MNRSQTVAPLLMALITCDCVPGVTVETGNSPEPIYRDKGEGVTHSYAVISFGYYVDIVAMLLIVEHCKYQSTGTLVIRISYM